MSSFVQESFQGGMNLLSDDTKLERDQYRLGLNLRNRFGKLKGVPNGIEDTAAPPGLKQEIRTFGNYIILFVAGYAYYRYYSATGWKRIVGFQMSKTAPRFWTEVVPVQAENYLRKLASGSTNAKASVSFDVVAGASGGNASGLVVQDNVNQPQFIYIDPTSGFPTSRPLQTYDQWNWTNDGGGTISNDRREYVPIGNSMAWVDGILYVTSPDFARIYRSVSGRPLDFVVNIDENGTKGGNAETTAYSVGVGGISCLRPLQDGSLFVAAGNANFSVSKNMSPGAVTIFGEYTFIRKFLFNATCISDKCIMDSLGDTKFIDITGVRSFNAILQTQNEGRNSVFSMMIQSVIEGFTQENLSAACILYDNYEFYGLNTFLGPAIAVFDTLTGGWVSFDVQQTGGSLVKMFSKIELTIQRLYAITTDDKLYTLYSGTEYAPLLRPLSISSDTLTIGGNVIPKENEHKLQKFRAGFTGITGDFTAQTTPIVQNEITAVGTVEKTWTYMAPPSSYTGPGRLNDANTNIANLLFAVPNCSQGSRTYCYIAWNSDAELSDIAYDCMDIGGANNPLRSQSR